MQKKVILGGNILEKELLNPQHSKEFVIDDVMHNKTDVFFFSLT